MNNKLKKVNDIDFIDEYVGKIIQDDEYYLLDILPKCVKNSDKYCQFENKMQKNLETVITKFYNCIVKLWLYNDVQLYVPDYETPHREDLQFYDKLKGKILDCNEIDFLEKIIFSSMKFEINTYLIFNDMEIFIGLGNQSNAFVDTVSIESLEFLADLAKKEGLHLYQVEPDELIWGGLES